MKRHGCKAVQYSDQYHCPQCGLTWDVNDPEPPACQPLSTSRPGYVDPATSRVAIEVARIYAYPNPDDITTYRYRDALYDTDPWSIVELDKMGDGSYAVESNNGRNCIHVGPDFVLFVSAKDYLKIRSNEQFSGDVIEKVMVKYGAEFRARFKSLMVCPHDQLHVARQQLLDLFEGE